MQSKTLFLILVALITLCGKCRNKEPNSLNDHDEYCKIIKYVDNNIDGSFLNDLVIADSLFYAHLLKQAYTLYDKLEFKASGSIFNYIQFKKHETAKIIEQNQVVENPIPDHSLIPVNSLSNCIDTMLYYLDEINLYNEVDISNLDTFFTRYIQDTSIPKYWKAKFYQIIGEYYVYKTVNQYKAYEYLKRSHELYNLCPIISQDILYLNKELIQQTVGAREYLAGKKYGEDMISVTEQKYSRDTVLLSMAYYMSAYADGLSMPHEAYISKYRNAFHILKNTGFEKMKQLVFSSFLYRFKGTPYKELNDSINGQLALSISKSDTFVNIYKALGEYDINEGQFKNAITHLLHAKNFLFKQKRFNPSNFWTISSELLECYRKLRLYDLSDQEAYANINYLYEPKCHNYQDILEGKSDMGFYNFIIVGDLINNLFLRYEQTRESRFLLKADKLITKANELIDKENYSVEENRRIDLLNYSKLIFQSAQKTYFELYQLNKTYSYLESFYLYQEKTKGTILYSESSELRSKFHVPDSITHYELDLKAKIRSYRMSNISSLIVTELYREYDLLNQYYKENYSDFYKSRTIGSIKPINLLNVVDSILFVSYSIVDSNLYTIYLSYTQALTKQKYSIISKELQNVIFCQSINDFDSPEYLISSIELFSKLIASNALINKKVIIFCPSGTLNVLNLGTCFNGGTNKKVKNTYSVFHTFSASTMNLTGINILDTGKTVAFSFSDKSTITHPRRILHELPGAYKNALRISRERVDNILYVGLNANFDNFIKTYRDSTVHHIHLAVHGIGSSNIRENVFLIFREQSSFEFDTLFGYTLLKYKSKIPLVTLATCESAQGQSIESEGLFNLVRYFKLNGALKVYANISMLNDLRDNSSLLIYI